MKNLFKSTPIIKIKYEYNNEIKYIYAKLEYFSFTGSIKDKVVYYILENALINGTYKKGMPIIEVSSGNTAISASALGALYNSPVFIFMPSWVSKERKKILKLYGASVKTYTKREGGFLKCIEEANKFANKVNGFVIDQFNNTNNVLAHQEYTAKEIVRKLPSVDTFVSGIGSGGTITGCGKVFKSLYNSKIISISPITKDKNHKIDGVSDGFTPSILDKDLIDYNENILDDDAINMSMKLSKELGLGVGISSGANFLGSVLNNDKNYTITVFPDDNKKYLSTLKYNKKDNNFISNKIRLISFEVI